MQTKVTSDIEPLILTSNLTKEFGSVHALTDLNLQILPGEIYGLLGPNGAGKTTTIKTLLGLVLPTAGTIKISGFDPSNYSLEVKSKIGYVAETPIVYESLSPREFLEFVVSIRKVSQADAKKMVSQLVSAFDIASYFDSPIATLSMGTKQKVAIIASLIHKPPILLMDEPLNSLDAKSSRIVKDLLSFHVQKGGAVLLSTHIMEIAESICTRIGIIYQGKIIAEGTLEQLKAQTQGKNKTLEDVFLRLTHEESNVAESSRLLQEAFYRSEDK